MLPSRVCAKNHNIFLCNYLLLHYFLGLERTSRSCLFLTVSRYSSGSMGQQSINIKTMQLADDSRSYKSIDGFLMPRKRKTLDSYMKINTSLNSSFK